MWYNLYIINLENKDKNLTEYVSNLEEIKLKKKKRLGKKDEMLSDLPVE